LGRYLANERMQLLLIFLCLAHISYGQDDIKKPFASKVIGFYGLGIDFTKNQDEIIVEAHKVRVADSGSYYRCNGHINDSTFIILGQLEGNDTINKRRYDLHFISMPDPEFTWDLEFNRKKIILHKDSLDSLQNLRIVMPDYLPRKPHFSVVKSTISWPGLKGAPGRFEGPRIPDSIAQRMTKGKDSIVMSMTSTIMGEDKIHRQVGASVKFILLEGEAYERAIDPLYDYNHFSDTTKITSKQFKSDDTLTLEVKPEHLFIWMPQFKEPYFVSFENENPGANAYCYDPPPTPIPEGKGYYLLDATVKDGYYDLIIYDKDQKRIRKKPLYFENQDSTEN